MVMVMAGWMGVARVGMAIPISFASGGRTRVGAGA